MGCHTWFYKKDNRTWKQVYLDNDPLTNSSVEEDHCLNKLVSKFYYLFYKTMYDIP